MTTALRIAAGIAITITAGWITAHHLLRTTCPCGNHQ